MRDIGKNIRDLRIKQNMTQDELAEKLFVTRQTVSNYETGRSRPDIDMLARIAQALNTDPNTILYGPAPAPVKTIPWPSLLRSVALLAAAYAVYAFLNNCFYQLAHLYFQQQPRIWLQVLGKPFLYFLSGWTIMEILHAFHPIPLFPPVTGRKVKIGLILVLLAYLLLMSTFLIVAPYLEDSSPILSRGWAFVFYTLLGIRIGQTPLHLHLICAFLVGILLRLCSSPKEKSPES